MICGGKNDCTIENSDFLRGWYTTIPDTEDHAIAETALVDQEGIVREVKAIHYYAEEGGSDGCSVGPSCASDDFQILLDQDGNIERVKEINSAFWPWEEDSFESVTPEPWQKTVASFTIDMWQQIQSRMRLLQSGEVIQKEPHSLDCSLCMIDSSGNPINEDAKEECDQTLPHEADLDLGSFREVAGFRATMIVRDQAIAIDDPSANTCEAFTNKTIIYLRDYEACTPATMRYIIEHAAVKALTGFTPTQLLNARRTRPTAETSDCKPTIDFAPKTITIAGTNFASGSAELTEAGKATLDQHLQHLLDNPHFKIKVVGHTDNRGQASANLKLSQRRADSVVAYFAEKGIAPSRMKAVGKGASEPKFPNDNEANRAFNRRVEIELLIGPQGW
ncbi:MAG: OmpA family protein [Deltaproteobacteria bacterium]|nr:OmpA family protein [Deltaproteobacteria bacterium]